MSTIPFKRPRVLTRQQAAHALGISTKTLHRLELKSKLRTVQLSARRNGIPIEEIERIAAGCPA